MIELNVEREEKKGKLGACLKVVGIGGAGGNAVNSMINSGELESVDFMVANTDAQALNLSKAEVKLQIGSKITKGLGAGSNPDVGRRAAEEDLETVVDMVSDSDILFLTAGLGGGTGSGAIPVISKAARELGILTVAIVATPFAFEGRRRLHYANEAIEVLKETVDTLIVVPNQKLLEISDPKISMLDAFALSDDVLKQAIKGISDIITKAGHINVDFADVREIMKDMGLAIMGTGVAEGENRARQAALNAISSPLLEDVSIQGAKGVLINITGNTDLGLQEINDAASLIHDMVSEDAEIILGSVINSNMGDNVMVTVIATGFDEKKTLRHVSTKTTVDVQDERIGRLNEQKEPIYTYSLKESGTENVQDDGMSAKEADAFDVNDLDTPTYLRKKAEEEKEVQ
jgi:cell division protein FtsZ